jgi:predicted Zn-dependent peptidase
MRKAHLKQVSALLAVAIISVSLGYAEIGKPLTLPEFQRHTLLNDMELVMLPATQAQVPFKLVVVNGAAFDPAGKWGLTYLTTRLLVEGGKDRAGQPLLAGLKSLGAELSYRVDWDAIWLEGVAPADKLTEALNILGQMVVQAQFDEEDFAQIRDRVRRDLEAKLGEPQFATYERFLAEVYGSNPYGHLVRGTPATLAAIQLPEVKLQYRKLFIPNQAHLAFYYTGDEEATFNALTRRWGSWVKGNPLPFSFRIAEPKLETEIVILDRPLEESVCRWGTLGVSRDDGDAFALRILAEYLILSLPGWAAEVAASPQVRASATVETRRMPGCVQINLQAPPGQIASYFRKFQQTMAEIQQGSFSRDRFEEAKRLTFDEMKNALGSQDALLRQMLEASVYNVGIQYLLNYGLRLDRFTPESFQASVKEHLGGRGLTMVVAGPAEVLEAQLAGLGKVRLLN